VPGNRWSSAPSNAGDATRYILNLPHQANGGLWIDFRTSETPIASKPPAVFRPMLWMDRQLHNDLLSDHQLRSQRMGDAAPFGGGAVPDGEGFGIAAAPAA
jgi:hypothetical protein